MSTKVDIQREIISKINTDKEFRAAIKADLEKYEKRQSRYDLNGHLTHVQTLDTLLQAYLLDYYSYTTFNTYQSRKVLSQTTLGAAPVYTLVDDKVLKEVVTSSVFTKERARRNEEAFNASAVDFKLDMFSYTIFENHITSLPKPLTGQDAARYIKKIPPGVDPDRLATKYAKLIWDNANVKSLQLSKLIRDKYFTCEQDTELPFARITNDIIKEKEWADSVCFEYVYFTRLARKAGIPLLINSNYITESELHTYITEIPKKNAMTHSDIIFAIDKLRVLNYAKEKDTLSCPYYEMAINQITSELSRDENKVAVTEAAKNSTLHLSAVTATANQLNEIIKGIK